MALNRKIERVMYSRMFCALVLWAVAGIILVVVMGYLVAQIDHPVANWLELRLDLIYVVLLIVGILAIFGYFWKKPWDYLDEVVEATEAVYKKEVESISLSAPLYEVENRLNQIKTAVSTSEKTIAEAEAKKNELVMYLAHDIRTPLTTVIGYLNLLEEAPEMPQKQQQKYIRVALSKSERINVLISELFDLTRYNTKEVPLFKTDVDLRCLLSQIKEEFYPTLTAKGNTVKLIVEDELSIFADSDLIARVFANLLKNAAAYSDAGTEINVTAVREGEFATISFQNVGDTMSPEALVSMFDKFSRLDQARTSETGGAGLGLPIAKEIVELHGGAISANCNGRTILFTVRLPIAS